MLGAWTPGASTCAGTSWSGGSPVLSCWTWIMMTMLEFESGVQSLSVSCESIYSNEARCLEPLSLAHHSSLPVTSIGRWPY